MEEITRGDGARGLGGAARKDMSKETYYKGKETYYKAKETYYKAKETY